MDFIQACREFISIDSTPVSGTKLIAEKAAKFCRDRGLQIELQEELQGGTEEMNVIARLTKERPSNEFLLQTHLDTVDPGPYQMWTKTGHNPFDAAILDGKIYGLGVADVKLDFLCKLEALAKFRDKKSWKLPPVLAGTYGEETGMTGTLKLIRKNKISAKMALIGEPTDLRMINAAKGFATVEIQIPFSDEEVRYRQDHNLRESTSTQSKIFNGKSAHSSMPHLGESAIAKMLDYLLMLPESVVLMEIDGGISFNTVPSHAILELDLMPIQNSIARKISYVYGAIKKLEKEFSEYRDQEFMPSTPTLNIGMIRTLDDHILIGGSCRIPPLITHEIYERWMRFLKQECEKVGGSYRVTDYKKPYRTDANSILVRGCRDELRSMGLNETSMAQSSTNEASLFSRIGIDCVCFGPGQREGNIHTPNEHVEIADLHKATLFYEKMIERFCI